MKKRTILSLIPVTALLVSSANAATTVWNINVGSASPAILTTDNFVGAATENTANSTWNSINSTGSKALLDSTGGTTAVTLNISGAAAGFSAKTPLTGDQLFATYVKSTDNATAFSVSIGGLTSGATYDLIVYADWYYNGAAGTPVTQTAGTGLTGTFVVNHSTVSDTSASVAGEDTNAADTQGLVNWTRFRGLKADGSNNLTFNIGGANSPLSGFQLIQVPEPSAALLGGLGFLVLLRRRRA